MKESYVLGGKTRLARNGNWMVVSSVTTINSFSDEMIESRLEGSEPGILFNIFASSKVAKIDSMYQIILD